MGVLHLLCGKIAAGKSTLKATLGAGLDVEAAGADHQLHYLDVADEVCKARLRARNAQGDHAFAATDEQFDLITSHFVAPSAEEGFNVVIHRP